jgi:hypothetical protein
VFAPVAAVFLTDYFLLRHDSRERPADYLALFSLAAGVILYRLLEGRDLVIGPTLATMLLTATLHLLLRGTRRFLGRSGQGQAVMRGAGWTILPHPCGPGSAWCANAIPWCST